MRLFQVGTLLPLVLPILWTAPLGVAQAAAARPAAADGDLLGNIGRDPARPTPAAGRVAPSPTPKRSALPSAPAVSAAAVSPPALPPAGANVPAGAAARSSMSQPSPATVRPISAEAVPQVPVATLDRVKAVPRKALLKSKRLEVAAFAGVSLNDAFYTHTSAGGAAIFYPHDGFGVGIGVDYLYLHARRSVNDDVRISRIAVPGLYNLPSLFAHADLTWVPLYGKVSVFDAAIIQFDLYATAGLGIASALTGSTPLALNLALGQHYALSRSLALRFEVRNTLFVDTATDSQGPRSQLQSYVFLSAGVSFFIPPNFETTFQ